MNIKSSHVSADPLSEKIFGLLGRLHVMLRREIGRVTDIKYMSLNADYCLHVIELAREVHSAELDKVCIALEEHFFGVNGVFGVELPKHMQRKPSVQLSSRVPALDTRSVLTTPQEHTEVEQHYVGRLR